jgi:hypothetical protein
LTDLTTFNPSTVDELFRTLVEEVTGEAKDWWKKNKGLMRGYMKGLAEASMQTAKALAEGRINEFQASQAFAMQRAAFEQTLQFSEFMTLALAQRLLDTVFRVLATAVLNRTGINLAPKLTGQP